MKLRYSEAFYSLQGEGKFVGVPSVFLRTFGCNFRCQNFGLPRGSNKDRYNPEVKKLIEDGVHETTEKFEDLPLVFTGCDTYASIYPEFKHLVMDKTIDEVVDHLLSLTPTGKWTLDNGQDIHLIMTGGEPLLAWQRLYIELFEHPRMKDLKNVTFETNTTMFLVLTYILSLLLLITLMWKKSIELLIFIKKRALTAQFISCRWADVQKVITSPFKKLQNLLWKKDTDSHQDSTLPYSEMPGELDKNAKFLRGIHTEEQFENVRKNL